MVTLLGDFLEKAEGVLGLGIFQEDGFELDAAQKALIDEREGARQRKEFALSDKLRKELLAKGVVVEDTPQGQKWRRK